MKRNINSWMINIPNASRLTFVFNEQDPYFFKKFTEIFVAEFGGHLPFRILSSNDLSLYKILVSELIILFEPDVSILKELSIQGCPQTLALGTPEYCIQNKYFVEYGLVDLIHPLASEDDIDELLDLFHRSTQLPIPEKNSKVQRPALFLDRDGIVIKDVPYNTNPQKVELSPGVSDLIKKANSKNYWVCIITNQSGIGRGLVTFHDYQLIHHRMVELLLNAGAWIDDWIYAPYYWESKKPEFNLNPHFRKPRAGMAHYCNEKLNIDFSKSIFVGDSSTDIFSAQWINLNKKYLYSTEKVNKEIELINQFEKQIEKIDYNVISRFSEVEL